MLDLVGNPNCWFCHAQAHVLSGGNFGSRKMAEKNDWGVYMYILKISRSDTCS